MTAKSEVVNVIVQARGEGVTLREAATLPGLHVATICRWQARDPALRRVLREAEWGRVEGPSPAQPAPRPRSVAARLPAVWGTDRGPDRPARASLLALWALAVVPVGELAAPSAMGLRALRGAHFMVQSPEERRLRQLQNANNARLTSGKRYAKNAESERLQAVWGGSDTPNRPENPFPPPVRHSGTAVFTFRVRLCD
jgi:hypothetical protein